MATYLEKFKQASMLNRRSFMKAGAAATVALAGGSLVACSSPSRSSDELATTGRLQPRRVPGLRQHAGIIAAAAA